MRFTPATLRDARRAHGFTQEALARYLGVSVRQINRWERGKAEPHWTSRAKLNEGLGLNLDIEDDGEAA